MADGKSRNERAARGQALVEFALIIPILFLIAVAVGDFGRVYVSAVAVESGAREAADYGAFDKTNWCVPDDDLSGLCETEPLKNNIATTEAEMQRRACTAVRSLPDYIGAADGTTCSNPTFTYALVPAPDVTPYDADCDLSVDACVKVVHVTLTYDFHTALNIPPFPTTVTIVRDSRYAISELPVGQ